MKDPSPRLGRGLAALLGETIAPASEASGGPALTIAIDRLDPSPYQPRGPVDEAALDELTSSIRSRGVLQPLLVRPHPSAADRFEIIAGERRWRAAQRAGLHDVPALVRPLSDVDAMAAALVENLQRQDLNPIEEAEGYRRLMDEFGLIQEQLADAVGKSRSHIANTTRLLRLPPSVLADVRRGVLSAGHARALLNHRDPGKAAISIIARGLNVRQTEALVARTDESGTSRRPKSDPIARDPDIAVLERHLTERLGLKVEIATRGRSGTLRLHYQSLDQLDGLVTLLTPPR